MVKSERNLTLVFLAIGSYLAIPLSKMLSGFIGDFIVDWAVEDENLFWMLDLSNPARLLGFFVTGAAFGFVLWQRFKDGARRAVLLAPAFLLVGQLLNSVFSYLRLGRDDVPLGQILGLMLTSMRGFSILVIIPAGAYAAVWYMQRRSEKRPAVEAA